MKISTILIGIAFIGFIFIGFMMLFADGITHYTTTTSMNTSQFSHINQTLNSLNQNTIQTKNLMDSISGMGGPFNILGGFIVGAYGSVKQGMLSIDLLNGIATDSTTILPLGNLQDHFIMLIGTLLLIVTIILLAKFLSNSEAL